MMETARRTLLMIHPKRNACENPAVRTLALMTEVRRD